MDIGDHLNIQAEWTAMVHGVRHAIFIRGILGEMGFPEERIPWFCDNRGAIQAASRIGFGGRTKHVDIKLKCTREYVERGLIEVKYVCSKEQKADILTKRIQKPLVAKFVKSVLSEQK